MLRDPTALPAWEVLQLATIGGAKSLGLERKIGSLEVGKQADIITVDLTYPNLAPVVASPFRNFIPNLVYSANGNEVATVIINGNIILSEGTFVAIDPQQVVREVNTRANRIFESAAEDWRKAGSKLVQDVEKGFL